jgi:HPt (histidine-containing phosphotransfer) domain-containing protein
MNGVLAKPLRRESFETAIAPLFGDRPPGKVGDTAALLEAVVDNDHLRLLIASFNRDKLVELFALARTSIGESVSALDVAWRENNPAAAGRHAHRLAGVASNFACSALARIAAEIESDCAKGGNGRPMESRLRTVLSATFAVLP